MKNKSKQASRIYRKLLKADDKCQKAYAKFYEIKKARNKLGSEFKKFLNKNNLIFRSFTNETFGWKHYFIFEKDNQIKK